MSHQTLDKGNDNVIIQFDRLVRRIIELIFVVLDRNNKSLNFANAINGNINNETNN